MPAIKSLCFVSSLFTTILVIVLVYKEQVFNVLASEHRLKGAAIITEPGTLEFVRQNGYVSQLTKLNIDEMTDEELLMTLHSYPDNTDVLCHRKIRMGKIGDGGWEICDDPEVRPRQPCIIYSFGINKDFSFDDDAAKVYGCHVYSFDPSMKGRDHYNRSDNVHFYKIGLDGKTYTNSRNWTMLTLAEIRKKLRHENTPIDLIKMDIEYSEWPSIMEITSSRALDGVRQFLVEYHVYGSTRKELLPWLKGMKAIEAAGFRKFYSHKNVYTKYLVPGFPVQRTSCYEIHYLRQ